MRPSKSGVPAGACLLSLLILAGCLVAGASEPPSVRASDEVREPRPSEGPKEFAPGVWIDWQARRVEVAARVVLRDAPLELLACSPRTREHESVLVVEARPLRIYQAMGLIGLEPGSPVRYDEKRERWLPPRGERLRLSIRYEDDGRERTVPARQWMRQVESKEPPERIDWVFAGSARTEDGRFAADLEGTVVCVVDFASALITVGALHSADNELLWLEANTEAVPEIGTPCRLIIESAEKDKGERGKPEAGEVRPRLDDGRDGGGDDGAERDESGGG